LPFFFLSFSFIFIVLFLFRSFATLVAVMEVQHLVVVVGASRGLGRALALELVRDLVARQAAPSGNVEPRPRQEEDRPPHVRVVLAARDAAGLASTAAAINKQQSQQQQHGVAPCVLEVDLGAASDDESGREGAVAAITAAVEAGVAEARGRGHAWRVVVVYAAGAHEPASVRADNGDDAEGAPCWRYSRADDWSREEVARWWRVNVGSAVALLSRLQGGLGLVGQESPQQPQQQQGQLVFVYLSSQAAEERWWPLGSMHASRLLVSRAALATWAYAPHIYAPNH
jgi:NAD(P)-dependent dehydrogenase (short-subunit alcohol dehydrogenase family)